MRDEGRWNLRAWLYCRKPKPGRSTGHTFPPSVPGTYQNCSRCGTRMRVMI